MDILFTRYSKRMSLIMQYIVVVASQYLVSQLLYARPTDWLERSVGDAYCGGFCAFFSV